MDTILTSDFTKISFQNARFYISSVLNDKVSSLTVFTIPICLKLQLVLIHIQFGHANYDCFPKLLTKISTVTVTVFHMYMYSILTHFLHIANLFVLVQSN